MAVTQATDDKKGFNGFSHEDSDGYNYADLPGGLRIYTGTGSPNGVITAPIGSLYINRTDGKVYYNSDAETTWALVGAQSA